MVRTLVTMLCLPLVGGPLAAGEGNSIPTAISSAGSESDESDGPAAMERLKKMLADVLERQARIRSEFQLERDREG